VNSADKTTNRAIVRDPDTFVVDDEPLIASSLAQIFGTASASTTSPSAFQIALPDHVVDNFVGR
jgi:hypothetical protein